MFDRLKLQFQFRCILDKRYFVDDNQERESTVKI